MFHVADSQPREMKNPSDPPPVSPDLGKYLEKQYRTFDYSLRCSPTGRMYPR